MQSLRFVPAIIWFAVSLWLLTLPGSKIPHTDWFDTLQVDKWVHVSLFFILCFLFMLPVKKAITNYGTLLPWLLLIMVTATLYGVIIEFVQRDFIPNRSFDIWDIAADFTGCLIAFCWFLKRKKAS